MELIFQSLIPLAFVISLGWFAGWRNIIDARHSSSLATYVMSFSFPCLLFAKTATTSLQHLLNYRFIAGLSLGLLGMYLVLFLVNRYLRRMSLSHSCQTAFVTSFPDMAFMGIPIFLVLFGEKSLISIVIGNVITSLVMIPLTVSMISTRHLLLSIVAIAIGTSLPCLAQQNRLQELTAAAAAVIAERSELYNKKDAGGIAAEFTADATFVELLPDSR